MLNLGTPSCKSLVNWKTACITVVSGTATMLLLEVDIYLPPHWFQYSSYPPVWCSLLNLHPHYSSRMPPPLNSLGLHPLASSTESPLHLFFFLRKPLLQQVYPLTSTTQSPPPPSLAFLILRLHLRWKEKPQPQSYTPLSISSTDPLQSFPGIISSLFPCSTTQPTFSHIFYRLTPPPSQPNSPNFWTLSL